MAPRGRTHLPITKVMVADGHITINSHLLWLQSQAYILVGITISRLGEGADEVSGGAGGDVQDKHPDTHRVAHLAGVPECPHRRQELGTGGL